MVQHPINTEQDNEIWSDHPGGHMACSVMAPFTF